MYILGYSTSKFSNIAIIYEFAEFCMKYFCIHQALVWDSDSLMELIFGLFYFWCDQLTMFKTVSLFKNLHAFYCIQHEEKDTSFWLK
jgi:hypothetical protein